MTSLKELNINKVGDLKLKSVRSWGGFLSYPILALDMDLNLAIHMVEDGVAVDKILEKDREVVTDMSYNKIFFFYDRDLKREDLTIFCFSNIGYSFPEDGLYTNHVTFYLTTYSDFSDSEAIFYQ